MYQQDYILRIIEQLGTLLRRMLASLREQRPEEALGLSTEALGLVLDMNPRLAESLSAESLVSLLGAGGRLDVRRTLALAEVFELRARAFADAGTPVSAEESRRSATVLLHAVLDHEPEGDAADRARELLTELGSED